MYKVIIAGGRDFNDYDKLKEFCNKVLTNQDEITVVCGMARGSDMLGYRYANEKGYLIEEFPAEWDKYGKKAGYIRNQAMADANSDALIAFWNGESRGTKHMIDIVKEKGLKIKIYNY